MEIPTLEPGCPWYELSTWALPNVKWCEASQCSWVTEPANTWSNLSYVTIGVGLLLLAMRSKNRLMRAFGVAQLVVGLSSGIYHASYTFVLQVLDYAAMYVFCMLPLMFNLRRLGVLSPRNQWKVYVAGVVGLTAITPLVARLHIPIQGIVAACVVAMFVTEAWAFRRRQEPIRYGYFFLSVLLITVAATFMILDATRLFCDPNDHLVQGHALWHLFSALSLLASYRFYEQFAAVLMPVTVPGEPRPELAA